MMRKPISTRKTLCLEVLEDRCLLSAGALDITFGNGGIVTTAIGAATDVAHGVAIYPNAGTAQDGKIVAAGWSRNGANDDFALARYNPSGSLDTSFSGDGKVTTALGSSVDQAWDVVLQTDGKIIAAGMARNSRNDDFALVRYNVNGSLDSSFGSSGKAITNFAGSGRKGSDDVAKAVVIQPNGKIVVAGTSNLDFAVVRYNSNGSLDTSFSGDGKVTTDFRSVGNYGQDIAIDSSGRIIVVGAMAHTTGMLGKYDVMVVRYNPNGSLDASFGGTGIVTLPGNFEQEMGLAVQPDGKVVVTSGNSNGSNDDVAVIRFDDAGNLDGTFDGDGVVITTVSATSFDTPRSMTIQADGKILIAGTTQEIGQNSRFLVARYNGDGSLDAAFGSNGLVSTPVASFAVAEEVAIQPDGKIVLAGWADQQSGNRDFALVRHLGDSSPTGLMAKSTAGAPVAEVLDRHQVKPLLVEALARWQATGVDATSLVAIDVRITDLPGTLLGLASGNIIWLDANAAGWGWFVDATPWDDFEFVLAGNQGEQNRVDLLTVLMHEIGHVLGHDHDEGGVMAETLSEGTRLSLHGVDVQEASWLAGLPDVTKKRDQFALWW